MIEHDRCRVICSVLLCVCSVLFCSVMICHVLFCYIPLCSVLRYPALDLISPWINSREIDDIGYVIKSVRDECRCSAWLKEPSHKIDIDGGYPKKLGSMEMSWPYEGPKRRDIKEEKSAPECGVRSVWEISHPLFWSKPVLLPNRKGLGQLNPNLCMITVN